MPVFSSMTSTVLSYLEGATLVGMVFTCDLSKYTNEEGNMISEYYTKGYRVIHSSTFRLKSTQSSKAKATREFSCLAI